MTASGLLVYLVLGGTALYAVVVAITGFVKHVRGHRALFAAIEAHVAVLTAEARALDHLPQSAYGRPRGTRQLVTGAGRYPLGAALVMPGAGAWETIITANARDRGSIRHITVYFPEFADPDMPDGPWMQI